MKNAKLKIKNCRHGGEGFYFVFIHNL